MQDYAMNRHDIIVTNAPEPRPCAHCRHSAEDHGVRFCSAYRIDWRRRTQQVCDCPGYEPDDGSRQEEGRDDARMEGRLGDRKGEE